MELTKEELEEALRKIEVAEILDEDTIKFFKVAGRKMINFRIATDRYNERREKMHNHLTNEAKEYWIVKEKFYHYLYKPNGRTYSLKQAYDMEKSDDQDSVRHREYRAGVEWD